MEKVARLDDVAEAVLATGAHVAAAFPVNVHVYVLGQLLHVLAPTAHSVAVAHEPYHRLLLALNRVPQRPVPGILCSITYANEFQVSWRESSVRVT